MTTYEEDAKGKLQSCTNKHSIGAAKERHSGVKKLKMSEGGLLRCLIGLARVETRVKHTFQIQNLSPRQLV